MNMNSILVNHPTQNLNTPYTLTQPVIPSTTVQLETLEEQTIRHYNKLIIAIIKVMDIQYITYCTNVQY